MTDKKDYSTKEALRIGWRMTWPLWLVIFPLLLLVAFASFWFVPFNGLIDYQPIRQSSAIASFFSDFLLFWMSMVAAFIGFQTLAIKWLLRSRPADF